MDENRRNHIIRNFVSKDVLKIFHEYSLALAMKDNVYSKGTDSYATKHEIGVGHCIDIRGRDPFTEAMLHAYRVKISEVVKKELFSVASFYRIYGNDCKLDMHTDNPDYEWSATLCMGYEAPESWPLYIEKEPFYLEAGDCLIYQGAKDSHGRKPFKGSWQSQVFLHYKEVKDGFDGEKNK
tara:strand:- start:1429 stop:1971 length:543 start_codon:yes stop_codon:yes gene_type:complete